jgi:peptide methionine sulfoxide reductase MsrA
VVVITKIEENKETTQETENELRFTFNQEVLSLEVMVNNKVLFDEIQDLTTDAKKKMQVSEKFNKFIFLTSEEQKKLEKEMLFKEEEEREKRKLQDIFRNF